MKNLFLIGLSLLMIGGAALAQDEDFFVKDVLEVNFYGGAGIPSGSLSDFSDSLGAETGFNYGLDIGYFLTNDLVFGFNFSYTQFSIKDSAGTGNLNHKLYSPNLYLKYYFTGESDFIPYLKTSAGLEFAKFTTFVDNPAGRRFREISYDPVFAYGAGAGIFYFVSDFSGLFLEANYRAAVSAADTEATYQDDIYKFGSDLGRIDIHAGVRILIAPSE
ncbi:MAG: outer membrane beta-barrel protein [candidate division Zixibacteria bacterium]|nr:outer membrane beta-barrel protein [candidate division Zixibacteria bacterium]